MDEPGHRSVDFTQRVESQKNLVRFWLAVYNLRANGGSKNIIAFSYAVCCLYQMEMHLYRVLAQIYSIWIWLQHLTLLFNSKPQRRTGRRTGGRMCYGSAHQCLHMLVFLGMCVCVCVSVQQTLLLCYCTMVGNHGALGRMLLLAGPYSRSHEENSCFTSMSGCEPCPCGSPHFPHFSSSRCAVTQTQFFWR